MSGIASVERRQDEGDRIVLTGVSWEQYDQLVEEFNCTGSRKRLTYDRGVLEVLSPLLRHELLNTGIASLIEAVAAVWEIDLLNLGSTTFRREDLARGFEPDTCFYFQESGMVRGKEEIDLRVDPSPELVIEIDITRSSLNKLSVYAGLGVPEVWRCNQRGLTILVLKDGEYVSSPVSRVLPGLDATAITDLLAARDTMSFPAWHRKVRTWAQRRRRRSSRT